MKTRSLLLLAVTAVAACAQEPDRITVPFTDASKPRILNVHINGGSITVRGYDGKDVIVESRAIQGRRDRGPAQLDGLRRIDVNRTGLTIEEQDNTVRISSNHFGGRNSEVTIQTPIATAVRVKTMEGRITVDRVQGEIEVNSLNGDVQVDNVSGSVIAHSLNGNVRVTMDRVNGTKPMSFSTLNGDIDVTLPPDIKARVKMKTDHGDVYSDFEMKLEPSGGVVEQGKPGQGRYRVTIDRMMVGTINGGGQEISFTTLNGKILLRQRK